jgi:hypothetical protein
LSVLPPSSLYIDELQAKIVAVVAMDGTYRAFSVLCKDTTQNIFEIGECTRKKCPKLCTLLHINSSVHFGDIIFKSRT